MNGVKISELPEASAPSEGDIFPVVQGGVTKRAKLSASAIRYNNSSFPTVGDAIDNLFSTAPAISIVDCGTFN